MAAVNTTKERIRASTAVLFRRNGYTGTGLKQIAAAAAAPFGSIYHFFPGGKEQLAGEVIRTSGAQYQEMVLAVLDLESDPEASMVTAFRRAADDLVASDFADACPIATIALEVASTNETLRVATAEVFDAWLTTATEWFAHHGVDESPARSLAFALINSLEGAFVLSRARRDTEALEAAGWAMARLVREAVGSGDGNMTNP